MHLGQLILLPSGDEAQSEVDEEEFVGSIVGYDRV